jgi:DNA-binding IscR family transcriptional regulator
MHVTAKADYAVRAVVELANSSPSSPRKVDEVARGPACGRARPAPRGAVLWGAPEPLQKVWLALRANLRKVLEHVTVADVAAGKLPKQIVALSREEDAWVTR